MATFTSRRYFTTLTFLLFIFKTLYADPNSSFSFKRFDKDQNFQSNFGLYGDAKVVNGGSYVQLTGSGNSSAGRVMYKKPIKLSEGNPRKSVSFSTYFSFSISVDNGDDLAFVMVPSGFNANVFGNDSFGCSLGFNKTKIKVVVVEFDTLRNAKHKDLNENHIGIDVGSFVSVKQGNASNINLTLNSGEKLHSWIDYEASSKRLEVRMSKFNDAKPVDPFLSYPIDISKMWKEEEEIFVGLSSSNGNASQTCRVYSWSFKVRPFPPQWMHSQPLDPKVFAKNTKPRIVRKGRHCMVRVLAALSFGAACGALGACIVLYLFSIFGNRRPVVPEDCAVDFEYKKVKVVADKTMEDGTK